MIDAHNHLHDSRLAPWREPLLRELPALGVHRAVVNGTREDDWPAVAALAAGTPWVLPSFGLHPWYVPQRTPHWREHLRAQLDAHPGCGLGEIGLDRWIADYDWPAQTECFTAQLAIGAERNLPVTIHCLQAWGGLLDILRDHPLPTRGFLLHAYGGPAELTAELVRLGAYFSFSTYFLHKRKARQREVFAALPLERLLIETDAPDMAPPQGYYEFPNDGTHPPLNHPANLDPAYAMLAGLRKMTVESLSAIVRENFGRLFM